MIRLTQVKLYNLKPQTLKHVEIIKVLDKPAYDTSLESLDLEIRGFGYLSGAANNISEGLIRTRPVSERSERASVDIVG